MRRPSPLKAATLCLALFPSLWAVFCGFTGRLGANPIEALNRRAGFWTLAFLAASLVPSAVRVVTGNKALMKVRRILGLTAFFHACAHLLIYAVVDQALDLGDVVDDVVKRQFITVGMASFVLLVPLAVTSTTGWVQRLGASRWQRLHRASYVAAVLGVAHFVGGVKADLLRPGVLGAVIGALLLVRAVDATRRLTRSMA